MKGTVMDIAVELMQITSTQLGYKGMTKALSTSTKMCMWVSGALHTIHMVPALSHCNDIIITSLG